MIKPPTPARTHFRTVPAPRHRFDLSPMDKATAKQKKGKTSGVWMCGIAGADLQPDTTDTRITHSHHDCRPHAPRFYSATAETHQ
mmetsp:Transcript_14764/g.34138  ORF Transcript_14764/g.34138 Transcript_14764/m.34138 type:complete len:85 (-) Transcript_14764:534-788(-)